MYEYLCVIKRVVDGDTVDVDIDLGFDVWLHNERIRIVGIDAPETRTTDLVEKQLGVSAKQRAEQLLPVGTDQILHSKSFKGKFGRVLGDFSINGRMFSEIMLSENHATRYK
jgi:micrococcal nuclease